MLLGGLAKGSLASSPVLSGNLDPPGTLHSDSGVKIHCRSWRWVVCNGPGGRLRLFLVPRSSCFALLPGRSPSALAVALSLSSSVLPSGVARFLASPFLVAVLPRALRLVFCSGCVGGFLSFCFGHLLKRVRSLPSCASLRAISPPSCPLSVLLAARLWSIFWWFRSWRRTRLRTLVVSYVVHVPADVGVQTPFVLGNFQLD